MLSQTFAHKLGVLCSYVKLFNHILIDRFVFLDTGKVQMICQFFYLCLGQRFFQETCNLSNHGRQVLLAKDVKLNSNSSTKT